MSAADNLITNSSIELDANSDNWPELGFSAQNILNTFTSTATNEVFHPQDLTAALTTSNDLFWNYVGKFVKVTNISTYKSIIVKITDAAPSGKGIELAYRPWVEIGRPLGNGAVKVELMA
ncbi:MAG TPA: hypothetical protein DC000_09235 [Clostridiales bacterium]|nr:hypothetical protein [Clostridiales bacterium]